MLFSIVTTFPPVADITIKAWKISTPPPNQPIRRDSRLALSRVLPILYSAAERHGAHFALLRLPQL